MLQNRPPVIVILGHVDHGKTSLLDYLRKSNIVAGEKGGITQHIRSFQLTTNDQKTMTFIDTPGHAAFAGMRQRGSKLADIAILIVSGSDGVMPQTIESLQFIKQQNLPFVVAITKSDLADFNADRVKTQLAEHQVFVEDLGGNVPAVSISVKTGQGISDLLEILGLLSELNPPQADPDGRLILAVLESRLDSKKGPLAVVIVTNGTLKIGQTLYQNSEIGKVRSIFSPTGEPVKTAFPSQPVEILGLSLVPAIGSEISDCPLDSKICSDPANPQTGDFKIILKADVLGSLEAIVRSLPDHICLLSSGTGDITENDVMLASANQAQVIAFNVKCPGHVAKLAEVDKVAIRQFQIIYELLDYLRTPADQKPMETITGKAQILAEFTYDSIRVAGGKVLEGKLNKTDTLKLLRGETLIGQMKFKSFKNQKTDLIVAKAGTEFGATFSPPLDFKVGDIIIAFTLGHG